MYVSIYELHCTELKRAFKVVPITDAPAVPFISLLITLVDRYELIWQPRCLERFRVTLPATPRRIMKVLKRNNKQNALVRDGAPME